MTQIFDDLYQRVWINQENPLDEYDGVGFIKPFLGLPEVVIVRDEYHGIWDFVKSAYRARASNKHLGVSGGLVLTGQPGIGKTLFLAFALVKALEEHIPVSYCVNSTEFFIFNEHGFQEGSPVSGIPNPEQTLCLVDSGVNLKQPPDIVFARINNYVVQTASPKPARWREWSKQRFAKYWVMGLWTKDEMKNLVRVRDKFGISSAPDPSRYTPLELFDIVGPSPRNCILHELTFVKTSEGHQTTLPYGDPTKLLSDTDALEHVIDTGNCPPSEQGEQFHHFFFGQPMRENPLNGQPRFRYIVPTSFLEDRLSQYIVTEKRRERYRLLCAFAPLPQAFALVYESYIVSHLCEIKNSLPCYLVDRPDSPSFHLEPGLSIHKLPVEPGRGMTEYRDNTVYVARPGFPSLDAFVISEIMTRVTMIQITVSERHGLKPLGVEQVIDELMDTLPLINRHSVRWSFLFVAPEEKGKNMAITKQSYKFREGDPKVKIGWINVAN